MLHTIKFTSLLSYTILLCAFFDILIIYDVPILRQIFGFIFLLLLPGFLFLKILNVKSSFLVTFLLSWGVSLSILMLFGLFFNNIMLSYGHERPLSTNSLLISFNIICITLSAIGSLYKKENSCKSFLLNRNFETLRLNTFEKAFLLVPSLFPALGAFGIHMMNTTNDNRMVFILFFLISIYLIFICLYNQKFSNNLYPIFIYLISFSIIILLPLRSNHLIGIDTHAEFYFFQTTLNNLHWKPFAYSTLDSTLSISLLPTICQSMLNISPEFLFRILFPIIYSISPLIIYAISKKYIEDLYAFLAACFFMFHWIFLWTEYNARTSLAILFFMLAILILFDDKVTSLQKKYLLFLFTASCVVSHYSTTYIFFFLIISTFLIIKLLSTKYQLKKPISLTYGILFFALIFLWYSLITEKAFSSGILFIKSIFLNIHHFFLEDARSAAAQSVLGKNIGQKDIPHKIEFVLTWMHFSLIAIGISTLIINYKQMSFQEIYIEKSEFLKQKFEVTYSIFSVLCVFLLIVIIMLPFVSRGYGMERLYTLTIIFLSTFFIIGAIILAKYVKIKPFIPIIIVLVLYLFSITGITYNIFDVPRSILLNSDGEQYDQYYVHDQESAGAKWLKKYNEPKMVNTDFFGDQILLSQATYSRDLIDETALFSRDTINGSMFLRYYNVKNGVLKDKRGVFLNLSDCRPLIISNLIYNNNGSEVYI